MKKAKLMTAISFILVASFGLFSVVGSRAEQMGEKREKDRKAILAHIDSIFNAFMQKDREKLRATHGTDWRGFLRQSQTIIRGIDGYMETVKRNLSGPGRMAEYRMIDSDVVFYGEDVAVVPYIADITSEVGNRRIPTGKLRVLDVYHKENGEWIQVASNTATHPDSIARTGQYPSPVTPALREELLKSREAVWRAYFANDRSQLPALVPPETIAIGAGGDAWSDQRAIFEGSKRFAESGSKLVRLEFPRTEIQLYGNVAIIYTTYLFEVESQGSRRAQSGRGTEIFVKRDGQWVNVGWHLDSGK